MFVCLFFFEKERKSTSWGQADRKGERESKAGSMPSTESNAGLILGPWDHDLRWNQESGAELTELPRCPCLGLLSKMNEKKNLLKNITWSKQYGTETKIDT